MALPQALFDPALVNMKTSYEEADRTAVSADVVRRAVKSVSA